MRLSASPVNEKRFSTLIQRRSIASHHSPLAIRYLLRFFSFSLLLYLLVCLPVLAEHTRRWRQSSYDEFLKGTAHGVAVRSDGRLELAPKFNLIAEANASYLWSTHLDSKGNLYAAGGSPAKVFRFDPAGKSTVVFESTDLAAPAIAFDAAGNLYVGTSPDGKVYRVSASGEKSVFFEPKTKYIWDLAFGPDGILYVATGDKGEIFAVPPDGKGQIFYSSDEAHMRVLGFDSKGNLFAGTDPNGRILRISRASAKNGQKNPGAAAAEGFVLYETSKREVTSIAINSDGVIYASAIGEKQRGAVPNPAAMMGMGGVQGIPTIVTAGPAGALAGQPQVQFQPFPPMLTSAIYRIAPDGAPEEVWTSREDIVYALGFGADGRLLAGTGNNGSLLAIDGHGIFANLAKSGASQITGIARGAAGKVFVCTSNPGKVFAVGPDYESSGSFESRSFDAQLFSQWGRIDWWSPPGANSVGNSKAAHSNESGIEFFVRTGNTEDPGKEWSPWSGPYSKPGSVAEVPSARFAQWKAVIHDGHPGDGIDWVTLAYLPRNVAPVIDGIAVQEPGIRAVGQGPSSAGPSPPVILKMPPSAQPVGMNLGPGGQTPSHFEAPPQGQMQKGYQTVVWTAHDENDDDLRYAVYFRGENERNWKLLKDKLEQKFYSWDTTTMPDGAYFLKIVASDAASNPPSLALFAERESDRFEVDNTPPAVEELTVGVNPCSAASKTVQLVCIRFTVIDAASTIERAQYSLDGGDWTVIAPIHGISDALEERYEAAVEGLPGGEHTVAVRAYDRFENVGSAKIIFNVPASKP